MNWSWLSFVVGLLVGWLIEWLIDFFYWRRRYRSAERDNQGLRARLDAARGEQDELEVQLAACREEAERKDQEIAALQARAERAEGALEAAQAEQAEATSRAQDLADKLASAEAAIPPEPQDLTRIEGIGPAIANVLGEAGIVNYAQLADVTADRLREILQAAGPRFRVANPSSWPQQAKLAAEERWDDLEALQDSLTAGRTAPEPGKADATSGEQQDA
jgi:predicted flap endonuclease-1-like 5' DNA nuclease